MNAVDLDPAAKIIIADDAPAMLIGLRRALLQLGFLDVLPTENGKEAWTALETNLDAHLVISDWNMPEMDGLELLARVRADARFAKLPFILISADAGAVRDKAERLGVSLVLAKPFDAAALQRAIASL